MSEKSLFFDNGVEYSSDDWAEYFQDYFSTGVNIRSSIDSLKVVKGTDMNVNVTDGTANILGHYYKSTSTVLAVAQTTSTQRIDRVVLRFDKVGMNITAIVKQGSASAAPNLQRDNSAYELCLATLTIPPATNTIANVTVIDNRIDSELCGIMSILATQGFQVPSGLISAFGMLLPPSGWLECNGQAVNRLTYSGLFTAIGTIHGSGDGSTTFNVPDLRAEFIRGLDNGKGIDTGRTIGTHQNGTKIYYSNFSGGAKIIEGAEELASETTLPSLSSTNLFGGYRATIRPRNVALLYCIKY